MLLGKDTKNVILAKRRTEQVILGAALFLAALLLLTACGGSGGASGSVSASGSASGKPISQSCNPPDMEGCFHKEDMEAYKNLIHPMVKQFFDDTYADMPHPKGVVYIPEGDASSSPCGSTPAEEAYAYCPGDNKIYLGQPLMWMFYSDDGDAAPAVGLAHEWGHHVQNVVGVPKPTSNAESVDYENQADCVAGAWIAYADEQGWIAYPDDINDTAGLLEDIAENEPNRTHGNLEERTGSMVWGIRNGLQGCNDFYPIIDEGTTPSVSSGASPSASPSASPTSSSSASASP